MQIQPSQQVLIAASAKPVLEPVESKGSPSKAVVAELGQAFAAVVQKSLHSVQMDATAVAQARRAIAENRLETPEAFDAAAEQILLYGI